MNREKGEKFPHFQNFKDFGKKQFEGREEIRVGDSNCGGLFAGQVTADIHNMFAFAEIIAHRSDCCEAKAASTFPTNKHTDFHVFPLAFPDGRADCTAAQAKPSRHDKTIVVQPCSHPMPSPVS